MYVDLVVFVLESMSPDVTHSHTGPISPWTYFSTLFIVSGFLGYEVQI